ncbi:unnamed protein product [Symbiodinium sp. CCMP2592]|nr:unnamed protein product [Symbiodinium sp. CCMP2592]
MQRCLCLASLLCSVSMEVISLADTPDPSPHSLGSPIHPPGLELAAPLPRVNLDVICVPQAAPQAADMPTPTIQVSEELPGELQTEEDIDWAIAGEVASSACCSLFNFFWPFNT